MSYERALKMLKNDMCIIEICQAVLTADGVSLISRHATGHNILLIFARRFLKSFKVKGQRVTGLCSRLWLAACVIISP